MRFYPLAHKSAWNKEINFVSDSLKATLHTTGYTPDFANNRYWADVSSSELATSGGYTVGGATVSGATSATTAAASWTTSWAATTAFTLGQVIKATSPTDSKTYLYRCNVAGTSAASAPTWPNVNGISVAETGGLTWENVGISVTVLDLTDPQWGSATFTGAAYLILHDHTPATDATRPLIAIHDFNGAQAGQGGSFTDQLFAQGALMIFHA